MSRPAMLSPTPYLQQPAENVTRAGLRKSIKEVTDALIMRNRYLGRLKSALRFARSESYIDHLPAVVEMKKPHSETKRTRVLTSDEIRAVWESLEVIVPTMPRGGIAFLGSVRIALLVGTHLGETTDAEWSEFDLDGRSPRSKAIPAGQPMWYIPAEHRKGQKGKKVAHWVSLAVEVLRDLHSITGDKPKVFYKAGYQARTYMLGKLLAEMRRKGSDEPFSYHDLRRACSTGLGELGCLDELNDLILGHVKRGVLAHYDHSKRIPERAEWLRRWADHVAECVGLSAPVKADGVAVLYLYETATGMPEIKAAKEPANAGATSEPSRRWTPRARWKRWPAVCPPHRRAGRDNALDPTRSERVRSPSPW